ncbi:trans-sulfuration enzyme family protein [Algihabitans albus]|uniref:trans-sulfuration enzyme family protein n=1 Tax=Algihabitans albus TaxID=2164067 RepID=UPI000E5CEF05|nr:aminotransferase class I/II-fold pyridoxal phosphate-dependent enzyme [Algihabitans albus]
MSRNNDLKPETLAAQALHFLDGETGAVVPPLHPSTTFARDADYAPRGASTYARYGGPAVDQVEALLARLEGAEAALVFASGLAASAAVIMALKPGDRIVCHAHIYWGFREWLEDFCPRFGLELRLIDMTETAQLDDALAGGAALVWTETPSNPLWEVIDIAAIAEKAHKAGARLAVDSTAATPVLQRPLELGADIVMHSATKYLNGHSDVLAGALAVKRTDEFWQRIRFNRTGVGAMLGAFEAWLLLRGLRTLYLRVRHASATALHLASRLQRHPKVLQVLYPGLPDHPGHEIACRQMEGGFGGMLSLRVAGGLAGGLSVVKTTRVFVPATSLGGVESLIEHRKTIEGEASILPDDLLRLSVGIEHPEDLLADLQQALDQLALKEGTAAE